MKKNSGSKKRDEDFIRSDGEVIYVGDRPDFWAAAVRVKKGGDFHKNLREAERKSDELAAQL